MTQLRPQEAEYAHAQRDFLESERRQSKETIWVEINENRNRARNNQCEMILTLINIFERHDI